jgi:hypothetical protein
MSTAGTPVFACERCNHSPVDIHRMLVHDQTDLGNAKGEAPQQQVSTTYHLLCLKCGHAFSIDRSPAV